MDQWATFLALNGITDSTWLFDWGSVTEANISPSHHSLLVECSTCHSSSIALHCSKIVFNMYTQALIAILRWYAVKKPYKQTNKKSLFEDVLLWEVFNNDAIWLSDSAPLTKSTISLSHHLLMGDTCARTKPELTNFHNRKWETGTYVE